MSGALDAFLANETANVHTVIAVDELMDKFSTTTRLLRALAEWHEANDDTKGAELIREFAVRFAAHEVETL